MSTQVLVIDNYDSFVYNLVHYLEDLGCKVTVKRNDQLSLEEAEAAMVRNESKRQDEMSKNTFPIYSHSHFPPR